MSRHGGHAVAVLAFLCGVGISANSAAVDRSFADIQRGRYLATAGDCVACHTVPGSKPFAGGRPIETPFGTIYSPNITPDRETGIGAWNDDQFYTAMHSGIDPAGRHLYPAFPYPYFTKITRGDVRSIRAYLDTVDPVTSKRPALQLSWPFSIRALLAGWNWLYFDEGTFLYDTQRNPQWNRGAYLVEALEHCGACHTAKTLTGGDKHEHALEGGLLGSWFAPDITADARSGIGSWSNEDLVEYLKSGRNKRSGATGMMAEVISDSTSHLSDKDLLSIAVYLKNHPGHPTKGESAPAAKVVAAGGEIYKDSCAACHKGDGTGVLGVFPPLAGNANVQSRDPSTLIHIVVDGALTIPTESKPTYAAMPDYRWKLDNAETAAVLTFIRNSWGNSASAVTSSEVESLKSKLAPPIP